MNWFVKEKLNIEYFLRPPLQRDRKLENVVQDLRRKRICVKKSPKLLE